MRGARSAERASGWAHVHAGRSYRSVSFTENVPIIARADKLLAAARLLPSSPCSPSRLPRTRMAVHALEPHQPSVSPQKQPRRTNASPLGPHRSPTFTDSHTQPAPSATRQPDRPPRCACSNTPTTPATRGSLLSCPASPFYGLIVERCARHAAMPEQTATTASGPASEVFWQVPLALERWMHGGAVSAKCMAMVALPARGTPAPCSTGVRAELLTSGRKSGLAWWVAKPRQPAAGRAVRPAAVRRSAWAPIIAGGSANGGCSKVYNAHQ